MTRLRHLAAINPPTPEFDRLLSGAEVPFVPLEAVWGSGLDLSRRRAREDVSTGYTRFREGDIVMPKITPTFQADRTVIAEGLAGGVAAGTTELHVIRVGRQADPRYIRYLLSTRPFLHGGEAEMIGVAGQKRVPDDWLRNLVVPVLAIRRQRAIADFLDAETARIDALIAKKHQQLTLIQEREYSLVDHLTVPAALDGTADLSSKARWPITTIAHMTGFFTDGDWVESPFITDSGIRLIQTGNVQRGQYREQGYRFVSESTFYVLSCTEVMPGDVLISRLAGPVGCACLAPDLGVRMIASVDVVIARTLPPLLPEFLVAYLSSSRHLALAELLARGTTMQRLSRSQVGQLPVPLPSIETQAAIVGRVHEVWEKCRRLKTPLQRQIYLLHERRQALITAAVTGELAIPGAAA